MRFMGQCWAEEGQDIYQMPVYILYYLKIYLFTGFILLC